jgi:hypothetical protein
MLTSYSLRRALRAGSSMANFFRTFVTNRGDRTCIPYSGNRPGPTFGPISVLRLFQRNVENLNGVLGYGMRKGR